MCTMTDPKSTRTQCDAAVPSRPIGLVFSSRRLAMIPLAIASELPLRAAGTDDEVVGHRGQAGEIEQDDVGGLLVLGQLDDPPCELQRRALGGRRGLGALWADRRRAARSRDRWTRGMAGSVTMCGFLREFW